MIVGFNLTKVNVEKKKPVRGKIRINHDLQIHSVTEQPLPLKEKRQALVIDFLFSILYEPGIGEAVIGGNVLYFDDAKKMEHVLSQWKQHKQLTADVSVEVLNVIMSKCNIKILALSQELNLPAHLPLPHIAQREDPRQYIG